MKHIKVYLSNFSISFLYQLLCCVAVTNILNERTQRGGKGLFWLMREQCAVVDKVWWHEREAPGHIVSAVRKQALDFLLSPTNYYFSLYLQMIFSAEKCCAPFKMHFILDSVFIYFVRYAYTKNVQIISVSFFKFYLKIFLCMCVLHM